MAGSLTRAGAGGFWLDEAMRRPTGHQEYDHPGGFFTGKGSVFDRLGEPIGAFGVAGAFYGAGLFADSEKARRAGSVGAAALAVNGLATLGLKKAAGRSRPYAEHGPGRWNGGGASFPSGHTSMAFTMAAVVAEEYESPMVDFMAYGLAGTVGVMRIHQDQHWASDVVGGAALGLLVGKAVSRWERRAGWARFLYSDGRGLYIRVAF